MFAKTQITNTTKNDNENSDIINLTSWTVVILR